MPSTSAVAAPARSSFADARKAGTRNIGQEINKAASAASSPKIAMTTRVTFVG
jgi:hypothetical protein